MTPIPTPSPEAEQEGRRTFAAELRRRRELLGWSQDRLGRSAGIDRQSVNRAERGATGPSVDRVYAYARALGCEPGDLLPPIRRGQSDG